MRQKTYPIDTGDCVSNVRTIRTGGKSYFVTARLRVSEYGKSFETTYNPKTNKLTIHGAWRLTQAVGEARFEAIEHALLLFFGGISATLTR